MLSADYQSAVYNLASQNPLRLLDSVKSSAIQLVLGVLHTSPTITLCAVAVEQQLEDF